MRGHRLLWTGLLIAPFLAVAADTPREIPVVAKNWEYQPNVIELCSGERVRLLIETQDRDHGFEFKAAGVKVKLLKGKVTPVEFTAPAPGTYEFRCAFYCGKGHKGMKGQVVVRNC
ncbi:Cytochrome c oxidase subunit 2 [bacterium HR11]|nr:Cytochrome c oxidase subunit 2 [bacterium HR11]